MKVRVAVIHSAENFLRKLPLSGILSFCYRVVGPLLRACCFSPFFDPQTRICTMARARVDQCDGAGSKRRCIFLSRVCWTCGCCKLLKSTLLKIYSTTNFVSWFLFRTGGLACRCTHTMGRYTSSVPTMCISLSQGLRWARAVSTRRRFNACLCHPHAA